MIRPLIFAFVAVVAVACVRQQDVNSDDRVNLECTNVSTGTTSTVVRDATGIYSMDKSGQWAIYFPGEYRAQMFTQRPGEICKVTP